MFARVSLACLLPLAACSGSGGTGVGGIADAGLIDASPPSVRTVACPPGVVPTVSATTGSATPMYMPASTAISTGGIVKFTMPLEHNVVPDTSRATDAGLHVDFGATVCMEFDSAGSFGFKCAVHNFTGTIVVR